jgi:hypothetical protein
MGDSMLDSVHKYLRFCGVCKEFRISELGFRKVASRCDLTRSGCEGPQPSKALTAIEVLIKTEALRRDL